MPGRLSVRRRGQQQAGQGKAHDKVTRRQGDKVTK
jgi:hypothetical protein